MLAQEQQRFESQPKYEMKIKLSENVFIRLFYDARVVQTMFAYMYVHFAVNPWPNPLENGWKTGKTFI